MAVAGGVDGSDGLGVVAAVALSLIHDLALKSACWIPKLAGIPRTLVESKLETMLRWSMFVYSKQERTEW